MQLASPVTAAPVSAVPATPEAALAALEDRATDLVGAAARRAGVVTAFDVSLGLASARLGQNVSASLGAIGDVRSSDLVATLHQANSAMAFAGAAARRAEATGIPVLVGTSDPTVATATGAMALDATGPAMLRLDVLSVAGQPIPSTPGAVPGDAALAQPGVSGSPLVGVGADATPVVSGVVLPGVTGPDLEAGTASTPGAGVSATGGGQTTALPGAGVPVGADGATIGVPGGVAPAPTGDLVDGITVPGATLAGVSATGPGATDGLADRTRVAVDGAEFTSATRVLSDIRAGLDVTAHGPGTVTLAVTPDPGPALERMQGLVDAVAQVAAVAGPQGASSVPAAPTPAGAAAPATTAASMWSSISSAASSFASSFASATPAAGPPAGDPTQTLGAVAAPLVAAVGAAFVDASGRPLIPGTTVQQGRVSLDREAFAREYVRDAVGVEGAIASVARSVASTSDAASDPRVGALAVRIQAELHQDAEYTIDETGGQRLDARQEELDRRAVALQTLLERLESESSWLGGRLR
ncbi:hypothetical protein [Mobilicoccus caccae]|uniref:Flagellar hook-associated protein 2 n=1 Tax=Mobilicoccus caccae TaxID=1859295 RepID=A0ABQ6IVF3_9MICO|nr:hypothetical protein [Mobilicoccus caccae]GMA40668.1 hypothetical protein GCM10025883_27130 [Mobilicoccus caccae]